MKILVDTNVIIDAIARRAPWNVEAEKIFLLAANRIIDAHIASSSVTDIYYLIKKHMHNSSDAKKVMAKLFSLFTILDVTSVDCIDALQSGISDYEDAVVANCADRNGMEFVVTRNIKDYINSNVKPIEPKDFIELIQDLE